MALVVLTSTMHDAESITKTADSREKWVCEDCESVCYTGEYLVAPNPFKPEWEIVGCPHCFEVGMLVRGCDHTGCERRADGGTPTPEGYKHFCSKHYPRRVG